MSEAERAPIIKPVGLIEMHRVPGGKDCVLIQLGDYYVAHEIDSGSLTHGQLLEILRDSVVPIERAIHKHGLTYVTVPNP